MIKILLILLTSSLLLTININAQPCNTFDATGCVCANVSESECQLLPDITASKELLTDYYYNPEEKGRLYISVSTPNVGTGPLRVITTDKFVCGTDTITSDDFLFYCPNGEEAKQLIKQRIFVKNGNEMSSFDRPAGSMTYHPTHSHMHVDEWGVYTLREKIDGVEPKNSPIVGEGSKLGFCLMDFGSCDTFEGHCIDNNDNVVTTDLPNHSLGGGEYTCGTTQQGISVGYTDIYFYNIEGMHIDIPIGTCDGEYWVVVEIDPNNNFLESNEDNNIVYGSFTLSKQNEIPQTAISIDGPLVLCEGETTILTARYGNSYQWSTGETTESIEISQPGTYSCTINTKCAVIESMPIVITADEIDAPTIVANNISICPPQQVQMEVDVPDNAVINWYSDPLKNNLVYSGNDYFINEINNDTILWAETELFIEGQSYSNEPIPADFENFAPNSINYNGALLFDVYVPFILESIEVAADTAGVRVFEIHDFFNNLIHSSSVYVQAGQSRVNLDFQMEVGQNYSIQCAEHPGFYRSNIGVNFPYEVGGILSVHGTNYGDSFYYYFYNWNIRLEGRTCVSPAVPVSIEYNNITSTTVAEIIDLPILTINTQPIQLVGSPAGGYFSGEGVVFNTFNPTVLNEGMYDITYTVNDENGCEKSTSKNILVFTTSYNFTDYELGIVEP